MVVVVPEHGGALKGDRMQVSGLRDIPSPSITDVPVGVKFFGMKAPHQGAPIVIDQPSSFLAISDLVVRVLDGKIFTEDNVDWKKLTSGLPQTAPVSENSNAVVIQYQDKPYVRLNGGDWGLTRSKNEKGRRVSPLRPGPGANCHYRSLTPV